MFLLGGRVLLWSKSYLFSDLGTSKLLKHSSFQKRIYVLGALQVTCFEEKLKKEEHIPCNIYKFDFAFSWFSFFNSSELRILISGQRGPLDLVQMAQFTKYSNGYHEGHLYVTLFVFFAYFFRTILLFWEALRSFTPEQQAKFLKFVTSCSRVCTHKNNL